jgi:hypothetical protein
MAGLVPAISLSQGPCPPNRGRRDIRAFTPVFDGLLPGDDVPIAKRFFRFCRTPPQGIKFARVK